VLGSLRNIQLIEGDIQILMSILINQQNKFKIETDLRIAKYNYGSRSHYSIENALLEKRLIYNNSLLKGKYMIYNMIDLKLCYDQQLVKIGLIVQESIGVQRLPIKLFSTLLPVIEYHICTSYGVSKEFYGGFNKK